MNHSVEPVSASRLHLGAATLALATLLALVSTAQAGQLNDSGQITCYNASVSTGVVNPATPHPVGPGFEGQDCTRGAAAADALGAMIKQGASNTPGRDYTKVSNAGDDLPGSAELGFAPDDWACTRDNVTGLVWEVKVNDPAHLRHLQHTYTWYDTDSAINGGNAGNQGMDMCEGTLPSGKCNTSAFREAVNAASLCGATDWRLPTAVELVGLVDYGAGTAPTIDAIWFPNTWSNMYWTGVNFAPDAFIAWYVFFANGNLGIHPKIGNSAIRLVRGGQ